MAKATERDLRLARDANIETPEQLRGVLIDWRAAAMSENVDANAGSILLLTHVIWWMSNLSGLMEGEQ